MKTNPDKDHLITSNSDGLSICFKNCNIKSSKCEKLWDIKIDNKLNFSNDIDQICKKAGQKLNETSRFTPYLDLPKWCMLLNAFFLSQFSYCPLVWMFYSRGKIGFMKDVYKTFIAIRNPLLLNYWKRIILSQF